MKFSDIFGRNRSIFAEDLEKNAKELRELVQNSKFLIIGGAGTIGQAVSSEIFARNPKLLHVVDISENNLVELVRTIRSTMGYSEGEFRTFAIDCSSPSFDALLKNTADYDYVLNLSALKHVRSEKDPFTLMRMIQVNVLNTISTANIAASMGSRKYFCVSTDKATAPINMMGASKRIMELFLQRASLQVDVSTARFANVAFSDGSLLHGFTQRYLKRQPISAPQQIRRYFISAKEAGELCVLSCLLGENNDIFFPKFSDELKLIRFDEIAVRFLEHHGFHPFECASEEEARSLTENLIPQGKWPVFFFESDTTGEKLFEEFFTSDQKLDFDQFKSIGIIKNSTDVDLKQLCKFEEKIQELIGQGFWNRKDLTDLFAETVPEFLHADTGFFLDDRM